jgi:hypothetical protein
VVKTVVRSRENENRRSVMTGGLGTLQRPIHEIARYFPLSRSADSNCRPAVYEGVLIMRDPSNYRTF